jgi:hypothetical protein
MSSLENPGLMILDLACVNTASRVDAVFTSTAPEGGGGACQM